MSSSFDNTSARQCVKRWRCWDEQDSPWLQGTHALTHTLTPSQGHTLLYTHILSHSHTLSHSCSHSTHSHTCTHTSSTLRHAHSHTHAHTMQDKLGSRRALQMQFCVCNKERAWGKQGVFRDKELHPGGEGAQHFLLWARLLLCEKSRTTEGELMQKQGSPRVHGMLKVQQMSQEGS